MQITTQIPQREKIITKIKEFVERNNFLPEDFVSKAEKLNDDDLLNIMIMLYIFDTEQESIGKDKAKELLNKHYQKLSGETKKIFEEESKNLNIKLENIQTTEDKDDEDTLLNKLNNI